MNIAELKNSGQIIFQTIIGSHAYGTNTPESDVDLKGFFSVPDEEFLKVISGPQDQISDETNDETYYNLKRAFELLTTANPNIIELLWMPEDCIKISHPVMDLIHENRNIFISKQCYQTHSGYAYAQIKKAKGQNKKVHNPQPEEMPKKEDFCWVIDDSRYIATNQMSFRPKSLKDSGIDLSEFHVSSLEYSHNMYRLYHYGKKGKGVFRGEDMLVCESIPKEDEFTKIYGLLIYNQNGYEKALKEWHSYWDWMKFRNSSRWIDQEKGKLNYDQKNMMHCVRLLMSGENILVNGEPIVRVEGDNLDYLMKIRRGELDYEEIMEDVNVRMERLEKLHAESSLPFSANLEKVEKLYEESRKCLS